MDQPTQPAAPNSQVPSGGRTSSMDRVRAALQASGLDEVSVKQFSESTATAVDAAAAIGTTVERIVKSLVFMAGGHPVLVLASGVNRVDLDKVGQLVGEPVKRANADQVRELTGFAIGGVPPLAHPRPLQALVDQDLLQFDEVWAAAGTPNSVFSIIPTELVRITRGRVADIKQ